MKNDLLTRLPMHRTPSTNIREEQLVERSITASGFDSGTLTPAYRLPEFIIRRDIVAGIEISNIIVVNVATGAATPVTFDATTELFYHQDEEYLYAAFKGQDLDTPLDCGLYYYLVNFNAVGETDWFYSQYFKAEDIPAFPGQTIPVVPVGYVRLRAGGNCRVGAIPYDKWDGFYQEIWLKADQLRPEVDTVKNVEQDENLDEHTTAVHVSRSMLLVFTCTMQEADFCHALQMYPLHSLEYWMGKGVIFQAEPDTLEKLEISEQADYSVREGQPVMRMRFYTSLGQLSTSCCSPTLDCEDYTVSPTITQQVPDNQFSISLPAVDFPEGYWATVMYRRDASQEFTSVVYTEAQITGGITLVVPPAPPDNFIIKVVVENYGDCSWESEEQQFSVG